MTHEDYIHIKEDGDNMYPKGTYAQDAMYILRDYLLGEEWNPIGPPYYFMRDESIYNTYIVEGIVSTYRDVNHKCKLCRIYESVRDVLCSKDPEPKRGITGKEFIETHTFELDNGLSGTPAQQALNFISDYLLGNDWYIVDPLCNFQANTYIVDAIMVKYPDVKYTHKLRRICKSVCDIVRSKD